MAEKTKPGRNYGIVFLHFGFFLGMVLMNFTMRTFEPFSLALYAAAMACGLPPF